MASERLAWLSYVVIADFIFFLIWKTKTTFPVVLKHARLFIITVI